MYQEYYLKNIKTSIWCWFAKQLPIFRRTSLAFNPVRVKAASSTALHKASALPAGRKKQNVWTAGVTWVYHVNPTWSKNKQKKWTWVNLSLREDICNVYSKNVKHYGHHDTMTKDWMSQAQRRSLNSDARQRVPGRHAKIQHAKDQGRPSLRLVACAANSICLCIDLHGVSCSCLFI